MAYMRITTLDDEACVIDLESVRSTIAHRGKPAVILMKGEFTSAYTVDHDELQRVNDALIALNNPVPPLSQCEDERLLERLTPFTSTLSLAPVTREHITEPADEKSARIRLAALWDEKEAARNTFIIAPHDDDYDPLFAYKRALEAYAEAARDYETRPQRAMPQSIVDAATAVEHARAREPFVDPVPELKSLYAAVRDELPVPRVMKRED